MARSPESIAKAKGKYDEERRIRKPVTFNCTTEAELLEFANSVVFSVWVKEKIAEEIAKNAPDCLK